VTEGCPARVLPLRVPITVGESLDSWLEALARRNGLSIGQLLPSLGWPQPRRAARHLIAGVSAEALRTVEHLTGLPAGRLDDAVLDRYLPAVPAGRPGSRYCPGCLAASGGRWPSAWRLPWVFACARHRVLLCDACPGCGKAPRATRGAAGLNPAGSCPGILPGGRRCAADLRAVVPQPVAPGGPMLAAWQWVSTILGIGANPAPGPAESFADLEIVAEWALRRCTATDFASFGPHVHRAWQETSLRPDGRISLAGPFPPASAALTGAIATIAHTILTGDEEPAIARIRVLLGRRPVTTHVLPLGMTNRRWARLSGPAQARFLCALDPGLAPAQRIRHRSGTPLAALPGDSGGLLEARARHLPQALWPQWTIRLMPTEGIRSSSFRSTIGAGLLVPGNPAPRLPPSVTGLYAYCSPFALNGVLRPLVANGHESVLAAICCLAAYLDTHGSPIDYQRRRALIPAEAITEPQWLDLCGRAGAHPGRPGARPGEARRLLDARRYLYQLLTGADLHDPRHQLAFRTGLDLSRYYEFTDPMTAPLRATLHDHARQLLDHLGIDEPLTWEPPAGCCGPLVLPGRDPADIDLQAVHQLVIVDELPVGLAARRLGTSGYHVRFALETVARPARHWSRSTPPAAWVLRQKAPQVLTREFFEREYLQAGKGLRQIAAETGFNRPLVAQHARQAGISLDHYSPPVADIDKDWLREQYQDRRRSYADIAAELGVAVMTVHGATRRHGIASRPPGVHSFPGMITKLGQDIPRDVRRAVEGGLQGWHRLRRFQVAMTFPTIDTAAASLGTHQSALVHQFKRLERDVGAKLYHPSTPRQAMRPTRRGAALLRALDRPDVRALLDAQAPDPGMTTRLAPGRLPQEAIG
jgi:hypothetical protein